MIERLARPLAAAATGAVLVAGAVLGSGSVADAAVPAAAAARPAATTANRPAVHVKLSSHGATVPSRLAPGRVQFDVTGSSGGFFEIFRARHSAGPGRLVADLKALDKTDRPKAVDADFMFVGGGVSGGDVSLTLAKGTYYAMNLDAEKTSAVTTVSVAGKTSNAATPKPAATARVGRHPAFPSKSLGVKDAQWLRVVNHGSHTQLVLIWQLAKGVSIGQVQKDIKTKGLYNSFTDFGGNIGSETVVSSSRSVDVRVPAPTGRYAVITYWAGKGGSLDKPAVELVQGLTVR